MEVIIEGSNIGISFSGLFGFLLLIYLLVEITSFFTTSTSFTHKIFLYFIVKYRIKKSIPDWWEVSKVGFITTSRSGFNRWNIFVIISRSIPGYEEKTSSEYLFVNNIGKVKKGSFDLSIKLYDEDLGNYKLLHNRNKTLEKLGI
jgi:hypothetical protein